MKASLHSEEPNPKHGVTTQRIATMTLKGDVEALHRLLGDGDGFTCSCSMAALWSLGEPLTESSLRQIVTKASPKEVIVEFGGTYGPQQPEICLELLSIDDDDITEALCFAASSMVDPPAPLVFEMERLARTHHNDLVREAAVAALGSFGLDRSRHIIIEATNDKPYIRRRAVVALAAFEGDDVEQALQRALTDRDPQVRALAEDLLKPDISDSELDLE